MDNIEQNVDYEIAKWIRNQVPPPGGKRLQISNGAQKLLAKMIANIKDDASPAWRDLDPDQAQKYAISIIPNILNDFYWTSRDGSRIRRRAHPPDLISSWELLHRMSRILDDWCFIPKDV